jgi:hypothetical protein
MASGRSSLIVPQPPTTKPADINRHSRRSSYSGRPSKPQMTATRRPVPIAARGSRGDHPAAEPLGDWKRQIEQLKGVFAAPTTDAAATKSDKTPRGTHLMSPTVSFQVQSQSLQVSESDSMGTKPFMSLPWPGGAGGPAATATNDPTSGSEVLLA